VAQTAWIMNATIRDNILFGQPYDEERYQRVLRVCQLTHDLDMLEAGDMTEIGENGVNLSGGQRQRVSVSSCFKEVLAVYTAAGHGHKSSHRILSFIFAQIARACYSDSDTLIFDDPLSALDPEVASKVFHECVCEFLDGKTRLLVTNQLQFLPYCSNIVALSGSSIIEKGSYEELMASETGEVKRLLEETGRTGGKKDQNSEKKSEKEAKDTGKKKKEKDTLMTKEERKTGAVSFSVYKKYLMAGGGYATFSFVLFGYFLSIGNGLATTSWISYWTTDIDYIRHSEGFYLGIFFGLAVTLGVVTFARSFMLARFGVRASDTLHRNLLDSIFHAPQSFFDTTPIGRILSRFSKDLYSIDIELAEQLDFFLFCSLQVVRLILLW
jgi:ABC-type multidrug transport system fused ATPase/permease subunit